MNGQTSLYIHIPFCISKCAYCDFFSKAEGRKSSATANSPVPASYIAALSNEIAFRLQSNKISELKTVYIGGGTPSLLSGQQFASIFDSIKSNVKIASDAEITVEVNPDDISKVLLDDLWKCGVNRISCGIQSMNDAALKKACRRADSQANKKALSLLHDFWPGLLSLDLISGLPGDDENTLIASLQELLAVNPDHISLYSLTIEEETPFGKELASGRLDYDFDKADKLWLTGRDFLESHGYIWYEVSNFCRPGKECVHNLAYWTHSDYIGCGSGASGSLYSADGCGFRWTNSQNIEKYIDFWGNSGQKEIHVDELKLIQSQEKIDLETSEFEFFMMGLRKLRGFYSSEYQKVFNRALPEKFLHFFSRLGRKGSLYKKISKK